MLSRGNDAGDAATKLVKKKPQKNASPRGARGAVLSAVATITEQIRSGGYAQGQRLSEAFLARDLGLSRNAVREALRSVAAKGLITIEPNKGARVITLNRQSVVSMLQLREVVEGLGAALAAANIDPHRSKMTRLLADIDELKTIPEKRGAARFFDHNELFHDTISEIATNPYLANLTKRLVIPTLRPTYFKLMDEIVVGSSLREHELIASAILDGDAATAEAAMRAHVRKTIKAVVRLSDQQFAKVFLGTNPKT